MKDREARIKKDQRVMIKDGEDTFPAVITSLSKSGMSVKTEHVFPTYKVVDVLVRRRAHRVCHQPGVLAKLVITQAPYITDSLNRA